ncbi:DUF1015 family protein [Enterococcus rotai]|uniref:DUF1015 family protein n=1 Tax=Enterococcus rotai TaxID=118060 RepID=UPI0032B333B8
MVLLLPMETSYLNTSGHIYDSEFLNLVQLSDGSVKFDERTLFLNQEEKDFLNAQKIVELSNSIVVFKNKGKWGLIANLPKEEYIKGNVKSHELVLPSTVQGMLSNFHGYNGEAAPVLLGHESSIDLEDFVRENEPDKQHIIKDYHLYIYQGEKADRVLSLYKNLERLFIGDGHHRLYTTSLSNFKQTVFACIMSFDYLDILPIHRLLQNVSDEMYIHALKFLGKKFELEKVTDDSDLPKGYVKMSRGNDHYLIRLIDLASDAFWNNDIYRLNTQIISQAFRSFDQGEIQYISEEMLKNTKSFSDEDVILETHALSKKEFIEAAKNDTVLPPKSTWVYPKFPSFLLMNKYQ